MYFMRDLGSYISTPAIHAIPLFLLPVLLTLGVIIHVTGRMSGEKEKSL